jgi:hypothetical protein
MTRIRRSDALMPSLGNGSGILIASQDEYVVT